jgi:adenylylsulfate kinase
MNTIATFEGTHGRTVICDFVCPTEETRREFNADITIWMNTIEAGRYDDTNKLFEEPANCDYIITKFQSDEEIVEMANTIAERHA